MFNRKHRKVRYAKCPYCGKSPVISEGRSITDKNELVMHYKCPKNHLTTGDTPYPNRALELWLLTVYRLRCPRGHISTSWFSYPAYASRQWKELVDEYKGKDTK